MYEELFELEIMKGSLKTLRDSSEDEANNEYLIDNTFTCCNDMVIDFDRVKTEYCSRFERSDRIFSSVDTIMFNKVNSKVLLIEFKNGAITNNAKKNIKSKLKDSLILINDLYNLKLNHNRNDFEFILVYNPDKLSSQLEEKDILDNEKYDELAKDFLILAEQEYIMFGLEEYEKILVNKVHTYNSNEFIEYYMRWCK